MKIRIGDTLGRYFDMVNKRVIPLNVRLRYHIKLRKFDYQTLNGIYEKYADFIPAVGDQVIDVGAQFGEYSIVCAKKYGANVIAIEPLKSNFDILSSNIEANNVRINTINSFISDEQKDEVHFENNMIVSYKTERMEKIQSMTLDSLEPVISDLNILKIDVEGFEMNVINSGLSLIKKFKPKIIIEIHGSENNTDVYKTLTNIGYKRKHIYDEVKGEIFDYRSNQFYSV